MIAAEAGEDDLLEADIAFHLAILRTSQNPIFGRFRDVVEATLRNAIGFTNRIERRAASVANHAAVHNAIVAREGKRARAAMRKLIVDALALIETAKESGHG